MSNRSKKKKPGHGYQPGKRRRAMQLVLLVLAISMAASMIMASYYRRATGALVPKAHATHQQKHEPGAPERASR